MRGQDQSCGEIPRKGKVNCRGIDIREIGENRRKSTLALEVMKPRGRPAVVDPNK
jgi:hypothetical protein